MKKLWALILAGYVCAAPAPVFAQDREMLDGSYIAGSLGWGFAGDTEFSGNGHSGGVEDDINISVAAGYRVDEMIRSEFEFTYRKSDIDNNARYNGDVTSYGMMINGYFVIPTDMTFRPYVMGGIGTILHDAEIDLNAGGKIADDREWTIGWQVGAGVNLELMEQTELYAGYRYQGATDAEAGLIDYEHAIHEALIGIRYMF